MGSTHSFFGTRTNAILGQEGMLEKIRGVAERVTSGRGYELADVELKREHGGYLVRLFVDKDGGIGLDELQSVSEEVSAILDAEDPMPTSYTLEVSSPGLDRPLKTEADYRRFVGTPRAGSRATSRSTAAVTGRAGSRRSRTGR